MDKRNLRGIKMIGMIVSLVACTLLCGIIGYLHWFFYGVRELIYERRLKAISQYDQRTDLETVPMHPRPHLDGCKRVLTFVAGGGLAGFFFVVNLSGYLSAEKRPIVPEVALGYTYYIKAKRGAVYGTGFEYLVVTYGSWATWGALICTGLIAAMLKINVRDESPAYPLRFFAGSTLSMVLYYLLWQLSLYASIV